MIQVKNCLWCQGDALELVANRKDNTGVLKCGDCGLFMNSEIPENPAELYQEDYYSATEAEEDKGYEGMYYLVSPAFLLWQNSFIEEVNEERTPKSFLEIGSATGSLLEILRENQPNLSLAGVDISDYAVKVTQQKGFNTQVCLIQDLKSKPKKDIIFSSETMEHLDDLKSFLRGVEDNLAADGTFLFYVPSIVEEDARKESRNYVRFRVNMEHLLHFTPDFFENELPKMFDAQILVKEFRTDFGPCILGIVSREKNNLTQLQKLFTALETQKIPKNVNSTWLKNLSVFCLKFGYFEFADKVIKVLADAKDAPNTSLDLVLGLASYHKGELEKASGYFGNYLKQLPNSQVGIKLLVANEKELNDIYREEIFKMKRRAIKAEERVSELEGSKLISGAIKLREIYEKRPARVFKSRNK